VVLDPFIGSGTTALVADRLQRHAIGIDLNTSYAAMAMERCKADAPLFTEVATVQPEPSAQLEMFAA
jgi:DNA modification methylase